MNVHRTLLEIGAQSGVLPARVFDLNTPVFDLQYIMIRNTPDLTYASDNLENSLFLYFNMTFQADLIVESISAQYFNACCLFSFLLEICVT
jgi:hypothetical protein